MKFRGTVIIMVLVLILLGGSFLIGEELNYSTLENRRMTTFDMVVKPVTDLDSEIYNANLGILDRFEAALKDQIFFRNAAVLSYSAGEAIMGNLYNDAWFKVNEWDSDFINEASRNTTATELDFSTYPLYGYSRLEEINMQKCYLVSVGQNLYRINGTDWIGEAPSNEKLLMIEDGVLDNSIKQLERIITAYPQLTIYHYFVNQIYTTSWFDSYLGVETQNKFEFLTRYLPEKIEFSQLIFEDFEEYKTLFFKSDHHWNYLGSEKGYKDVYKMMADDLELTPMKEPIAIWNYSELYGIKYRGSRAKKLQWTYNGYDDFIVYEYDLGDRTCYVMDPDKLENEIKVNLTLEDDYKDGKINEDTYYDHYIKYYGTAVGENGTLYPDSSYIMKIVNNNNAVHNLLIVGDSTQRAYRDVIASHFGTAVYIDYRILNKVSIDEIIEKNNIDTMFIGGMPNAYWYNSSSTFSFSEKFES